MHTLRRNYLLFPIIALLTLLLAALACSGGTTSTENTPAEQNPSETTPASAQKGNIGVQSITLMRDNGSGDPGDVVQNFTPADHNMHFEVKTTGLLSPGSKVKWVFTAVDTTEGKNLQITTFDLDVLIANDLTATLTLDRDWPVGSYKADVSVNGAPLTTVNFTVVGETTGPAQLPAQGGALGVESVKLLRDDGSGNPGEGVQSFTPADHKMHFEINTTGMLSPGSKVKWVFTGVDTSEGKNLSVATFETDVTSAANVLTATVELDRDWPTGSYKGEVYLDDQLLTTVDYTVQ
jgi:hypothetical protein